MRPLKDFEAGVIWMLYAAAFAAFSPNRTLALVGAGLCGAIGSYRILFPRLPRR